MVEGVIFVGLNNHRPNPSATTWAAIRKGLLLLKFTLMANHDDLSNKAEFCPPKSA